MPGQNTSIGYESISEELREQIERERGGELKPEIDRGVLADQFQALKTKLEAAEQAAAQRDEAHKEAVGEAAKELTEQDIEAHLARLNAALDAARVVADEAHASVVECPSDQVDKFNAESFRNDIEHYFTLAIRSLGADVAFFNATAVRGDHEGDWLISARISPR